MRDRIWLRGRPLQLAAVLMCLVALGAVLWLGAFHWPEPVESGAPAATAAENSSKRTATLAVLAGAIALGGLIVSISNHRRQAKHDAHVHDKDRQDLIHQRYATAIGHLGSEKSAVQAAAVYALEDVIEADPARRVAIVQALVAFVAQARAHVDKGVAGDPVESRLDAQLIAAQVAIARQKEGLGAPPAWLPGADLRSFDLRRADLVQAHLVGADLTDANLRGALLVEADLNGVAALFADFSDAKMTKSELSELGAMGARFCRAHLYGSDLSDADLEDAQFVASDLQRVRLDRANLVRANLSDADLTLADLREARLREADLSSAVLGGVNLSGADLSEADLHNAVLESVSSWDGANVWNAKGVVFGWCPDGAVRMPPDAWEDHQRARRSGGPVA